MAEHRHKAAGAMAAWVFVLSRAHTVPSTFSVWAHLTRRTSPPGGPLLLRREPGYKWLSSLGKPAQVHIPSEDPRPALEAKPGAWQCCSYTLRGAGGGGCIPQGRREDSLRETPHPCPTLA